MFVLVQKLCMVVSRLVQPFDSEKQHSATDLTMGMGFLYYSNPYGIWPFISLLVNCLVMICWKVRWIFPCQLVCFTSGGCFLLLIFIPLHFTPCSHVSINVGAIERETTSDSKGIWLPLYHETGQRKWWEKSFVQNRLLCLKSGHITTKSEKWLILPRNGQFKVIFLCWVLCTPRKHSGSERYVFDSSHNLNYLLNGKNWT